MSTLQLVVIAYAKELSKIPCSCSLIPCVFDFDFQFFQRQFHIEMLFRLHKFHRMVRWGGAS